MASTIGSLRVGTEGPAACGTGGNVTKTTVIAMAAAPARRGERGPGRSRVSTMAQPLEGADQRGQRQTRHDRRDDEQQEEIGLAAEEVEELAALDALREGRRLAGQPLG